MGEKESKNIKDRVKKRNYCICIHVLLIINFIDTARWIKMKRRQGEKYIIAQDTNRDHWGADLQTFSQIILNDLTWTAHKWNCQLHLHSVHIWARLSLKRFWFLIRIFFCFALLLITFGTLLSCSMKNTDIKLLMGGKWTVNWTT